MIWTLQALDAYLTKPKDFIDKTKMAIAGIKDADDRANLIAYLASVATD
jgi:cytochrome c